MFKFFKKIYLLLLPLAFVLFFLSHKIALYKNEVSALSTLDGKLIYASDPIGYYKKTLIKSYPLDDTWRVGAFFGTSNQPLIAGKSAIVVDLSSDKVLYEKNSTQRLKIASLTKIMTAIIALEHKNLQDKIYVTRHAAYVGEDTMYLTTGEIYSVEELLYGLMLNSGNDAAYALADGIAGDSETFVKWMNQKAKELGLENTFYADPSGLDDATYSTAQDLVKLTRYAYKNTEFAKIVATLDKELTSDSHKYLYLKNETNLLSTYPGVAGVKTGYTEEAGLCLVTYANNGGHQLIGVVLNSIDRKGDMVLMLNHAFSSVGVDINYSL